MELNAIAQEQRMNFPPGVSEHVYRTRAEMTAFVDGVSLANDLDVECGPPFVRNGLYVVRVRVGNFGD